MSETRFAMNLPTLIEQFGSEELCRGYLLKLRWPDGVECLKCGSKSIARIGWNPPEGRKGRYQLDCNSCRHRFSVTAGTVFHDSHLPLWKWFLAVYLICESKKGISANQLKRTLNVSYKTAWYLCHRIRSAMVDSNPAQLSGTVEVDETYVGGKVKGHNWRDAGNKTMVMGAIERGGAVRLRVEPRTPTAIVLRSFVEEAISDAAKAIYTDSHPGYAGIGDADTIHDTVNHAADEWVRADVHTNSVEGVWSLFKRSIVGSYHQLSVKHLPAYLDEFSFRFNNRENPFLFRDTLKRLVNGETLTYSELTTG